MADGNEDRRKLVEAALDLRPANDSRPVFERLADFAARGTEAPEGLTLAEIKQVCFALCLLLEQTEG